MMKMNMPTEDAQDCMRELGERSMGNWFENMDKMDIQAERRNTAEARRELVDAKEKLAEAENRLCDAENKLCDAENKLCDAENKLCDAENKLADTKNKLSELEHESEKTKNQTAISIINITKKYSGIRESAVSEIEIAIGVSRKEAEILVEKYW